MNAVGVYVSKDKSMVALLRLNNEMFLNRLRSTTYSVKSFLIYLIQSIEDDSRIAMEHTERYCEPLIQKCSKTLYL